MSSVRLLAEGCALVDCGPLYATMSVSEKGEPLSDVALDGARYALTIFETLVRFLPTIRRKAVTLVPADAYPKIVNEMISAALIVEDPDFTPLAAVAGATVDCTAAAPGSS